MAPLRRTVRTLALALLASAAGCAGPRADTDTFRPIALASGDAVAIVLREYVYVESGDDGRVREESFGGSSGRPLPAGKEDEFARCLGAGLRSEWGQAASLPVVGPDDLWAGLAPGRALDAIPRTDEALAALLREPGAREFLARTRLRYLAVAAVSTSESPRRGTLAPLADSHALGFAAGSEWARATRLEVSVLDLSDLGEAARISTSHAGREGCVYGGCVLAGDSQCLLPIPIPPFPYTTMTESRTCSAAAAALREVLTKDRGE